MFLDALHDGRCPTRSRLILLVYRIAPLKSFLNKRTIRAMMIKFIVLVIGILAVLLLLLKN